MTLADSLAFWGLARPRQIALSRTGTVWHVVQKDGRPAALKLLRAEEAEEARGADYLQALGGQGAVQVLARNGQAILLEWCEGPPLGDLCRSGQDDAASDILCDVIGKLRALATAPATLEPLESRMAPLTVPDLDGDAGRAARIARHLLATQATRTALHGDLHQDNILCGARGWLAIDPKGVWGDPAYETANAFRNPDGAGSLIFDPARIARLADRFARRLGLPRDRVLGWAAAHCALSMIWAQKDGLDTTEDQRLLPILLAAEVAA
jgi:streptomycin 6-kinase